jgi:aspartate/methionine/tyrosine aminotransferase
MRFEPSERVKRIHYPIREVTLPARALEKKGIKILKLNIGDPCAYDFDSPPHLKEAIEKATKDGWNGYTPSEGYPELLEAIAGRELERNGVKYESEDLCVTAGITESIQLLYFSALNPGDEILIPGPTYPQYISSTPLVNARPIAYHTIEAKGWLPDLENIKKKITPKTKALVVINPNNPTGALYDKKFLQAFCDEVGSQNQFFIISDEIYDELTYEGEQFALASIGKDLPVVTFNGLSKTFLSPGWRIGWAMFHSPNGELEEIKQSFFRLARARLCPNSICQRAAIAALNGPKDYLNEVNKKLKQRRDYSYKRLNQVEGISTTKPKGAFYIFPRILPLAEKWPNSPWKNDKEFVLDVLNNAHVLLVNGSGFDEQYGASHFRSVILPPIDQLEEAFNRIEKLMEKRLK